MQNNLVILTMAESQFQSLLINGALESVKYTSKILPDDSVLKDNETYQQVKKAYRNARDVKETLAFNLITNP